MRPLSWLSRYGGYALILAGWLVFSSLLPSAAGPADISAGQRVVAPSTGTRFAPNPVRLIANSRRPAGPAAPDGAVGPAAVATAAPTGNASSVPLSPQDAAPAAGADDAPPSPPAASNADAIPAAPPPLPPTNRIVIPRIGVDAPVIDVGVLPSGEMETAAYAAGRLMYTAQAGDAGNSVIAAHNDIQGEVFRRLPELQPGDEALLFRGDAAFRYRVEVRTIVREDGATEAQRRENAHWMDPTDDSTSTFISCYPYRIDTHRVIVRARLVEEVASNQ